jgi:hypothetical protein
VESQRDAHADAMAATSTATPGTSH